MTSFLLSLTLAAGLLTGQYAPQKGGTDPLADPVKEARVQKLGKALRCAVCQGVSIADSPASMARAQLDTVRELVAEGKTDEEIVEYFVERYGEWVLLEPPKHGFNWIVWLGPLALVAGGLFIISRQVKRGPEPAATTPAASSPPAAEAEDPYLQAVRRELDQ
ncbi:cytochrome c-type biogenesis protein [Hyalangium minutum]|uniref:Cytochrome c-type biogenesis protein n=1 Tax=Hyalangium minutum TaxID=394096 RepID=A0A085WG64_9BACT|nr:cytochrome c-type biogenesis protein [Hyalangium minutum]KFE66677.1 Cytochrome c heme lyase subunit CcmL [Hyalangium minutum]